MSESYQHYLEHLFADERLTKLDCEIYFRLRSCSSGFLVAQKHMVRWTGKSQGAISKAFQRLESCGYVVKDCDGWVPNHDLESVSESFLPEYKYSNGNKNIPAGMQNIPSGMQNIPAGISSPYIEPINNLSVTTNTPPPTKRSKPKTTVATPECVDKSELQKLIENPRYGDGCRELVLDSFEEMVNWSVSGSKRKACWKATLRNWIKRNRPKYLQSAAGNRRPQTFSEIERDNFKNSLNEFMQGE